MLRLSWRAAAVAVAALATLLVASRAIAASASEEAEALIHQGVELRQQGKDERALPLFQKAYDLVQSPRTAGQLGLAEMAVGYWIESDQHLSEALQEPDHPWVAKSRRVLEDARTQVRKNIAEIVVAGSPAGASVTINHKPAGTLPLPGAVRVGRGRVDVEVSAPGYVTGTRSQAVGGGERQQITVSLERAPAPSPSSNGEVAKPAATTTAAGVAVPAPVLGPPPAAPPPDEGGSNVAARIGVGLGIVGGAALIGAVVETLLWQKHRSDFNSNTGCDATQSSRGAPGCSSLYDSIHTSQTLAIVGYVTAGVLGVGSAALLITAKPSEPHGSKVACAPALGAAFVSCRWSF
jgi:hypothetical protein